MKYISAQTGFFPSDDFSRGSLNYIYSRDFLKIVEVCTLHLNILGKAFMSFFF